MAAETLGGDPPDYRDGFAAFNVLDMGKAMVWDHIATSHPITNGASTSLRGQGMKNFRCLG